MLDFCTNTIYNYCMEEKRAENIGKVYFQKVKEFLELDNFLFDNQISVSENIKNICCKKLCNVVGINCKCNYKNKFFDYFANITGEAVCQKLNIPITIADVKYRLVKYNGINFVDKVKELLNNDFLEASFVDIFQFLDEYKYLFGIN